MIEEKNKAWRLYVQSNKNDFFFGKFTSLQIQLSDLVETRKQNYHFRQTEKLRDQKTSPKVYWSLLKTFLNNKKIPCIPPIFYENDFVIDFQKKVEIFNRFFAKQRIIVPNSNNLPSVFIRKTDKYLSTVTFYENLIKKAVRNLDPNKAHGHDMLSIRMLQICEDFLWTLCGPLRLIFHPALKMINFLLN